MSAVTSNGNKPAVGARQAALADANRALAEGAELSGSELGRRHGRSSSWGRAVAREARQQAQRQAPADTSNPQVGDGIHGERNSADFVDAPEPRTDLYGHQPAVGGWQTAVTALAVVAVALAAAWASAGHLSAVASRASEGTPWLLPVSVDGLLVAASMVLYRAHQSGQRPGVIPWAALLLGIVGSVAGNVVAVNPGLVDENTVSVLVAAWPPLALALSFELLLRQLRG